MKAAGKTFEPVTYAEAGHGFMRAGEAPEASDANRQARIDAWARWKKILGAVNKRGSHGQCSSDRGSL